MEKSTTFNSRLLPYLLLVPQLAITFIFFYWPASQACGNRSCARTRSACRPNSSASRTTSTCSRSPNTTSAMVTTVVFSSLVAALSLSIALLFASQADKT